MSALSHVRVALDDTFAALVRDTSHHRPVLAVFFTAPSAATTTLTSRLTRAVANHNGAVLLVTCDATQNQRAIAALSVRNFPTVFGFREGKAIAQFTGVQPQRQIDQFIDDLLPSLADQHVARARSFPKHDAILALRAALEANPGHREAALGLAELLWESDPDLAQQLATRHLPDPVAQRVLAKLHLQQSSADPNAPIEAFAANPSDGSLGVACAQVYIRQGAFDLAISVLLDVMRLDGHTKHLARSDLLALCGLLGEHDPRAQTARTALSHISL